MEVLRTGFVGETPDGGETLDTVYALLRLFMKDALVVAGRYAHAHGRRCVGGTDMRHSLMYCARTFFEQDDAQMASRVAEEAQVMKDESEESGEESDDEESGEESDEESATTANADDLALARHVDSVAATWALWAPEDPVHQLIKRAIDNTPVSD